MNDLTTRFLTGVFSGFLVLCGLSSFAQAERNFIPLDGSDNIKPEDYGYKVATSVANEQVVVQIDLNAKAAKSFRSGGLTLSKAGSVIVKTNVELVSNLNDTDRSFRLFLDTQAVDDGQILISSENIEGMPTSENFAGFCFSITKLLKNAAAAAQTKNVECLKAVVQTSVTKIHPNEPFKVAFRIENPTEKTQSIRMMGCSWYDNWRSNNPAVSIVGWACKDDGPVQELIEPGKAFKFDREAELTVAANTPSGKLTFRMGFTFTPEPGTRHKLETYWSAPIVLEVVAGEAERANPPLPTRPNPETPEMRNGSLPENHKEEAALLEKQITDQGVTLKFACPAMLWSGAQNNIKVTIRNENEKAVEYYPLNELSSVSFEVSRQGSKVEKTAWGKARIVDEHSIEFFKTPKLTLLKPGEEISVTLNFTRFFDLSVQGKYEIQAAWAGKIAGADKPLSLKTPPLACEVDVQPERK